MFSISAISTAASAFWISVASIIRLIYIFPCWNKHIKSVWTQTDKEIISFIRFSFFFAILFCHYFVFVVGCCNENAIANLKERRCISVFACVKAINSLLTCEIFLHYLYSISKFYIIRLPFLFGIGLDATKIIIFRRKKKHLVGKKLWKSELMPIFLSIPLLKFLQLPNLTISKRINMRLICHKYSGKRRTKIPSPWFGIYPFPYFWLPHTYTYKINGFVFFFFFFLQRKRHQILIFVNALVLFHWFYRVRDYLFASIFLLLH